MKKNLLDPIGDIVWLPSGGTIDGHGHGRDMNQRDKITLGQYLFEARLGHTGVTVFMPNTDPPITTVAVLREYLRLLKRACKEEGNPREQYVYFGATDDNFEEAEKALDFPEVVGLKIYPKKYDGQVVTTGTVGVALQSSLRKHCKIASRKKKVIAVHCDDPYIIAAEGYSIHAEVEYVEMFLEIAAEFPSLKVIICHVSCTESARRIWQARKKVQIVGIELCPQYLMFDNERTNWNPELDPVFYHCFNNLRGPNKREFLSSLLFMNDPWLFINSDSACHTEKEKIAQGLGGIPSHQERVAVAITLAKQLGLSNQQLLDLIYYNAGRFLGIPADGRLVPYRLEERIVDWEYNNGIVVNPWKGLKLFSPVERLD